MSVITDELCLPPQGVVTVWEWDWIEDSSDAAITHVSETEASITYVSETSLAATSLSDSDETNCSTENLQPGRQTSTVTFKCIGTQHDKHVQGTLEVVSNHLDEGKEVPVNIYPEPTNPRDTKAVAFKCWIENDWHRIGYVVSEARDEVNDALQNGKILEVKFSWARYLLNWVQSGPGWYAGINITIAGQWSTAVHRSASSR